MAAIGLTNAYSLWHNTFIQLYHSQYDRSLFQLQHMKMHGRCLLAAFFQSTTSFLRNTIWKSLFEHIKHDNFRWQLHAINLYQPYDCFIKQGLTPSYWKHTVCSYWEETVEPMTKQKPGFCQLIQQDIYVSVTSVHCQCHQLFERARLTSLVWSTKPNASNTQHIIDV